MTLILERQDLKIGRKRRAKRVMTGLRNKSERERMRRMALIRAAMPRLIGEERKRPITMPKLKFMELADE